MLQRHTILLINNNSNKATTTYFVCMVSAVGKILMANQQEVFGFMTRPNRRLNFVQISFATPLSMSIHFRYHGRGRRGRGGGYRVAGGGGKIADLSHYCSEDHI